MKHGVISSVGRAFRRVVGGARSNQRTTGTRQVLVQSGLFDAQFYQETHQGRLPKGMDPLDHYIQSGAKDGFAPNPWFETSFYLTENPDVAEAGMNPLLHFAQHGWKELRSPSQEAYDLVWHWVVDNRGDSGAENPMKRHCALYRTSPDAVVVRTRKPLAEEEVSVFVEASRAALAEQQIGEGALCAIGRYAVENNLWAIAEEAFHALILQRPDILDYRLLLADMVNRQGRTWQVVAVLTDAANLAPENADLLFNLGDAEERRGRYVEAVSAFGKALAINGVSADWHYRHGYALEQAGREAQAKAAYDKARQLDELYQSARFGVGALHQNRGLWKEAADAYAATAALKPADSTLWFKLGFAYDRCYEWAKAQHAFSVALSLQFVRPYWHYRLGFVLERQEKWHEAAGAYRTAADMDAEHRAYWYYRCGYAFEKAGAYIEACSAYLMTTKACWEAFRQKGVAAYAEWFPETQSELASPTNIARSLAERMANSADNHLKTVAEEGGLLGARRQSGHVYTLARGMEARGDREAAVQAYRLALDLSADHVPAWHSDLGSLLTRLGRYDEACEAFRNSRILKRPYGVDSSKYEADKHTKMLMEYCEYLETLPIRKDAILYDSWLGGAIGCNPYAIFRDIIDRPEFAGWTHIWAINDPSGIPKEYAEKENVIFIPRNCDAYRRYLATAEYLINNVTFPHWFIRRKGQKYLNTWHGTPLKALARDVKREFMTHGNVTRNFLHATHLLSPNPHTSDVLMKSYDVDGIYAGKLAETGYPRIDQVVNMDEARRRQVLEELRLKPGKPIVLYAPTWRGVQGNPQTDTDRVVADVSAMISEDYQLVFRGHHMMEAAIAELNIPVAVASQRIDSCDLLSIVDVLVTDYSSILFDFLPAGRPIVYYAYDLEEYAAGQGLYFDMVELPGTLCTAMKEVRQAIMQGLGKFVKDDPAYQKALARFCPFEDGNATRRAVEFLFFGSGDSVLDRYEDTRKSIVMYNGMFPVNGITSSYLNLLRSLEGEDVQISTLLDPAKIVIDPVRMQKFREMPQHVKCIAHIGTMEMTPEEHWIVHRFNTKNALESQEMWGVYWRAYQREYRRVFGDMKHEAFVNFEGYNALTSAIAAAAPDAVQKTIYLHNDMIGERDVRLPYLQRVFQLYDHYDKLVSVSRAICQVNRENLCQEFDVDEKKFVFCDNTIDADGIISMAQAPIDDDLNNWFGGGSTFICLARMSPEKGQAKLLRAFGGVLQQRPDAKLVILGDGPLRQDLNLLVDELGVRGNVKLAGLRMNPFPALKAADCLVLPSDHEGQGLVLVEAMVLGKPIIATDIVTSRDVLGDQYGELVENSENGLRLGMLTFLERGGKPYSFSASEYQIKAIRSFRDAALSERESGPVVSVV